MKSRRTDIPDEAGVERDVVLIERIRFGDADAVGELYDRHGRLLYGLILRILRDQGEAEEVLQEVFLVVWKRSAMYDRALGSPAAWLVSVARNKAIDRIRATAVRRRAIESAPIEPEIRVSPEMNVSCGEQYRSVIRALDTIPREQRILIEDAYFLGFTHSELAERHKLPLGTVKTRIRTGLLILREQLSQMAEQ